MDRFVNYHFHSRELQCRKKCVAVDKYVLTSFSENTLILKKKQKKTWVIIPWVISSGYASFAVQ